MFKFYNLFFIIRYWKVYLIKNFTVQKTSFFLVFEKKKMWQVGKWATIRATMLLKFYCSTFACGGRDSLSKDREYPAEGQLKVEFLVELKRQILDKLREYLL